MHSPISHRFWRFGVFLSFLGLFPGLAFSHSGDSSSTVEFKGTVVSKYSNKPLIGIVIEVETAEGNTLSPSPTDSQGVFTAQLSPGAQHTVRFFKPLSVGNALVSSKTIIISSQDHAKTFLLPISTATAMRGFDFKGAVSIHESPFEGELTVLDQSNQKIVSTVKVKEGRFQVSMTARANDRFYINLQSEDSNYTKAYQLDASNWNQERHLIQVGGEPSPEAVAMSNDMEAKSSLRQLTINFQGKSDAIPMPSKQTLSSIVEALKKKEGETVSVRGFAPSYNIPLYDLTQRRVLAVVAYLKSEGINEQSIHYSYAVPTSEDSDFEGYLIRIR